MRKLIALAVLLVASTLSGCSSVGETICSRDSWDWANRDRVSARFDAPGTGSSIALTQDSDEGLTLNGQRAGQRVRGETRALMLAEARQEHALRRGDAKFACSSLMPGLRLTGEDELTGLIVAGGDDVVVLLRDSRGWVRCPLHSGEFERGNVWKRGLAIGGTLALWTCASVGTLGCFWLLG